MWICKWKVILKIKIDEKCIKNGINCVVEIMVWIIMIVFFI